VKKKSFDPDSAPLPENKFFLLLDLPGELGTLEERCFDAEVTWPSQDWAEPGPDLPGSLEKAEYDAMNAKGWTPVLSVKAGYRHLVARGEIGDNVLLQDSKEVGEKSDVSSPRARCQWKSRIFARMEE
jgi:hypothetical protein